MVNITMLFLERSDHLKTSKYFSNRAVLTALGHEQEENPNTKPTTDSRVPGSYISLNAEHVCTVL